MKAIKVYGLIGTLAALAVCATAMAQDGPPQGGQGGPPPMGMGQGGPGRMGGRRMGPPMEPLFMRPDVQKELKLTDEQIEKLQAIMPPRGEGGPDNDGGRGQGGPGGGGGRGQGGPGGRGAGRGDNGGGPGDPGGDMQPRMGGGPDQMDGKIADILSDHQMNRLKELRLQRQGGMALMRKEIANKIGLSDEERQRIRGMIDESLESMGKPDQGQRPDRKEMEAMHAKLSEQILDSLSNKEKSKWEDLTGKRFKFDENWHPQRPEGGPGGDRGRGDGQGDDRGRGDDGPPPPQDDNGGN